MKIRNYFFLTGSILMFLIAYVDAHELTVSSECDGTGQIDDVNQIPCIMENRLRWNIASSFMKDWFSGKYEGKSMLVDINTARNLSASIGKKEDEMKKEDFLFRKVPKVNKIVADWLVQALRDDGLIDKSCSFDYVDVSSKEIDKELSEPWKELENERYMHWTGEGVVSDQDVTHEFTGAFANVALRLNVKGKVFSKNGISIVILTGGGIYLRDSYSFEGSQPLGCWSKDSPFVTDSPLSFIDLTCDSVSNSDFRNLDQGKHDFRIFTDPSQNIFNYDKKIVLYISGDSIVKHTVVDSNFFSWIVIQEAFKIAYDSTGSDYIGYPTQEGIHCWSDYQSTSCVDGVWISDYRGGVYGDGDSALIYSPTQLEAYLIKEGFWGYYKLFSGYKSLGAPVSNEYKYGDGYRQDFEKGYLVWSPSGGTSYPAWGITHYKNGIAVNSCTDDNTCTGDQSNGKGGISTQSTDPPASGKLPDFITSKVTMGNKDGNHEQYTWKINETAYVHDYIDNIGDADWEGSAREIKIPFYLSKGSKKDDSSKWVRVSRQNIKKEHLKVKDKPKHESITFKLQDWANDGTIMPGRTYNFVVCADRPKDENNGDGDVKEKHKSNNCSTEAVFYVDYGPPRNVDLLARNLALTGGRSLLQAGEKYGLQVEVSNIGTEQPWNGFSTNYEIKGPGTGGVWQKIGEDTSRASSLYPNATHFEAMDGDSEVNAPMVGGDYVFRACADYSQAVPETDESNNCTAELPVYIVPPPMPDIITEGLQLTHGRTSLIAGELYGLTVNVRNIGDATPSSYSYTKYEIKGPGTNDQWQQVSEEGTKAEHLEPGMTHWEEISDEEGLHIPAAPGTYTARACADYKGNIPESDEGNNCSEITFEVESIPAGSPSIVITNPTHDDDWRSDETDHDVRWDRFDFPSPGNVRVEYSLDGGATWRLIDDNTTNDGKKHWEDMCDFHTIDTHHAYIRVTSLEYPYVYDVSDEFTIDHAAECE